MLFCLQCILKGVSAFTHGISDLSLKESFTSKVTQSSKSSTRASLGDSLGKNVKGDLLLREILLQPK